MSNAEMKINNTTNYINTKTKLPINLLFRETDNNKVLFLGEYMEVYLPTSNFDRKLSSMNGKYIETFGLFRIHIWNSEEDAISNSPPKYITRYNFSSRLITIPHNIIKRNMTLDGKEDKYYILIYKKNDIFINNTVVPKMTINVKEIINLIFEAFIPGIIKYEEIHKILLDCSKTNNVDFGVSSTVIETIVSELARYKKDLTMPFRRIINKKGIENIVPEEDYSLLKLTDLPHIKSTFTSLSFQNIDYSITASAKRHRKGEKEEESPVEKIIKY